MANPSETTPTLTRFVAFYSYKGGVGRTLALANCARALIAGGKTVVLLDFDLEAPGLQHFDAFKPKSREKKPPGFAEYLDACLQDGPPKSLDGYIHACKGNSTDKGKAWLMPAGRHGEPGYLAFLNSTTWSDFYTRQDGYKILENLRGHIIAQFEPDYVFIDARTGLSEIGGIATHQLADIVVLVFNLNGQNLEGVKRVFDSIRKAPLNPAVILVASPVPVVPMDKGTPFAKKMQDIKKDFSGAVNNDKPLIIPYHPLLAFDDRLLVDDGDLFSSDAPYHSLVEAIQHVAAVDADIYLQQMTEPMQRGDWRQVQDIALQGLAKNLTNIDLLFNLASAYYFTGTLENAIATIDRLIGHHVETKEPSKQELIAQALFNKGVTLGQLQRPEEAITAYDELLGRFGDMQAAALQEPVARALVNKGAVLEQLQRPEEAITAYDELLGRFGDTQAAALQGPVAKALFNKGVVLGQLQRPEETIAAFDELLGRFGDAQASALHEQVAKALFYKGVALGKLQRLEEAMATYDELIQRFGESQALAIQDTVASALNDKGFAILLNAKRCRDDLLQRQELLLAALLNFEQALTRAAAEIRAMILGNQGYALFLLGRVDESEPFLKEALTLGGRTIYEVELADSDINPLPEDTEFRALLERLWQAI